MRILGGSSGRSVWRSWRVVPRAMSGVTQEYMASHHRAWSQRTHVQLVTVQDSARDIMS